MLFLPTIDNGGRAPGDSKKIGSQQQPGHHIQHKKEQRSLLEISQNISSIRNDDGKKLRSRSYDPSSGDEKENQRQRKKLKTDRSKSVSHGTQLQNLKRTQEIKDKNKDFMNHPVNVGAKNRYPDTTGPNRRVRFNSSSEESVGNRDFRERSVLAASSPKPRQRDFGNRDRNVNIALDDSRGNNNEGSPTSPRRQPAHGTHQARLEAARSRARVWAETYSDPGPSVK